MFDAVREDGAVLTANEVAVTADALRFMPVREAVHVDGLTFLSFRVLQSTSSFACQFITRPLYYEIITRCTKP